MRVAPPGAVVAHGSAHDGGPLFTDRSAEATVFSSALEAFRSLLDTDEEVETQRRNLLVFHGAGGIGKTTLSRRLESWVTGRLAADDSWGPVPSIDVSATARIDLHNSLGQLDLTETLLALRSGVSSIKKRWPAFDLAFAAYWSAVRPGEPLPSFGGRPELADAVGDTVSDVLGDVGSLAEFAASGTGAGLGIRAVRHLIGRIRRRRDLHHVLDAFEDFDEFLLRCADIPSPANPEPHLACEIAGALSWELCQEVPHPLVVVFVDATERLVLDARRAAEGLINDLVYRMPNVLFVSAGRSRCDWDDDSRSDIPFRGQARWPGLARGAGAGPGQHLVHGLSDTDAKAYMVAARRQYGLQISDALIDEIVAASGGVPQYLDLAREVALSAKSAGNERTMTVADVTGSLPSLVNRVFDDIPPDEQRVLRAAALFRSFDLELVAAAAGVDHGCARRAVDRPLIDEPKRDVRYPYRMHDVFRSAIRGADHRVSGGWTERDWQSASTRAVAAARLQHDHAKTSGANRDVLDALGIAIALVCDQDTKLEPYGDKNYEDWLSRAIVYAPSIQGLVPRIPITSTTAYGQHVIDFIVGKSIDIPVDDRIELLRTVFGSKHPLRLPAGRHLGYTLRAAHRWNDALRVFDHVVALAPTTVNMAQRPLTLSLSRRFTDAEAAAMGTPRAGHLLRLAEYAHGRPERYFSEINGKKSTLRNAGRQREYLEEEGDLLARRAFFDTQMLDAADIQRLRDQAEEAGHRVALRAALLATVLRRATDESERAIALHNLKSLDQAASPNGVVGFRYAFAAICDALVSGDRDRIRLVGAEAELVNFRTRPWIPVECFLETLGIHLSVVPTQWLEPSENVRARWEAHLRTYLRPFGATLGSDAPR